jgi:hypothetical protein
MRFKNGGHCSHYGCHFAFVTITFLMWEKPCISIFVEIGALQNLTHFGRHLKNGCQNDHHFEIALVTITYMELFHYFVCY